MNKELEHYECEGQISISDWIADRDKIREVDVIGLLDDPVCPECGYYFCDYDNKRMGIINELDSERCPCCRVRLDWTRYHRINDNEELGGIPLDELKEGEKRC